MKAFLILSKTIRTMVEATDVKDMVKVKIQNDKTGESVDVILINRGMIVEPSHITESERGELSADDEKNAIHIYARIDVTDDDIIEVLSDYFNAEHVNHFTEGPSLN